MNNGRKDASLHFKEAFERLYERSPLPKILQDHFEVQKSVTSNSHNLHVSCASLVSPLARTVAPANVCQKIFQSLQHAQSDHNNSAYVSDSDQSRTSEKSCDDVCPKLNLSAALKRNAFKSPQAHIDGSLKRGKRNVKNSRNYPLENLDDRLSPKIPTKNVSFTKVNLLPVSSREQGSPSKHFNSLRSPDVKKRTRGITDCSQKEIRAIVDDRIHNLHWSSDDGDDCSIDQTIQDDDSIVADNSLVQNETDSGNVCLQQLRTENGNRDSQGFGTELNVCENSTVDDNCRNNDYHSNGPLKSLTDSDSDSVVKVTRSLRTKKKRACPVITESDHELVSNDNQCQRTENCEGQKKCRVQGEKTHVETDGDKGIKLYKWLIKSIPEVGGICVAGQRKFDDADICQSLEIVKRLDRCTVETKGGFQYKLTGAMDIEEAHSGGFSDEVIKHFLDGFPDNWEELIENFYQMENGNLSQEKLQDTEDSDSSEDTVSEVSHVTAHDLDTTTDDNHVDHVTSNNVSEYVLYDWIIKPVSKWQGICIEGKKSDCVDEEEYWHSSLITERINSHTVKSMSGSVYRLVGDIDRYFALEAGFSKEIVRAFRKGFPVNWLDVIERYYQLDSANGTREKISQKVTCSENKTPIKENVLNDSVCTPAGRFITLENLKKTRSGRTVKPALAWWTGQRIKTDCDTNKVRVVHTTVYAKKILKEMAQDFLNIPKHHSSYMDYPPTKTKTTSGNSSKQKNPQQHKTNKKRENSIKGNGSPNTEAEKIVNLKRLKQKGVSEKKHDRKTRRKTEHNVSEIAKGKKGTQKGKRPSKTGNADKSLTRGRYHMESQPAGTRITRSLPRTAGKSVSYREQFPSSSEEDVSSSSEEDGNEDLVVKGNFKADKVDVSVKENCSDDENLDLEKSGNAKKRLTRGMYHVESQAAGSRITRASSRTANKSVSYQEHISSSSEEDVSSSSEEDGNENSVVQGNFKTDKVDVSVKENCLDDENLDLEKTVMSVLKKSKQKRQSKRRVNGKTCYEAKENRNVKSSVIPTTNVYSTDIQDEMSKCKTTLNNNPKSETALTDVNVRVTRSQSKTVPTRGNLQKGMEDESSLSEEESDDMFVAGKTAKTLRRKGNGRKNNVISTSKRKSGVETRGIQNGETSWTKNEIERLYEAVDCLRPDDPSCWSFVAQKVKSKSEKECKEYYYKEIPEKKKKAKNSNKPSADKETGQKSVIGKVGTLKRKRQLRDLIDNFNEGYEDHFIDSTPFRSRSHQTKIPCGTGNEMDVFEELGKDHTGQLQNIHTPVTRFFRIPVSERRTPVSSILDDCNSIDREEADKYIHHLKKKKCLDANSSSKNVSATPVAKKKTNYSKSLGDLFAEEDTLTDNSVDSDADYYWSDAENN